MRKLLFIATVLLGHNALFAQNKPSVKPSTSIIEAGEQLISKSDCMACHKVDKKLLGPSYIDVALKYSATESNYLLLASKIVGGGSGNWGKMSMPPHAKLAAADAKKMVQYILSLRSSIEK